MDGTPTVTNTGRVGDAINANIRGLVWHDGFFWGVDATTDTLRKIILSTDGSAHTLENVGSYSQFVGPITNPQGFGVVNGVGYISALDNEGSLWELRDFKFTDTIADQSWTVGTAVSVSAPATEDGANPITYAISPALVAGVTLDTSTGGHQWHTHCNRMTQQITPSLQPMTTGLKQPQPSAHPSLRQA